MLLNHYYIFPNLYHNFYELKNVSPNFRIADTTEIEILEQETLTENDYLEFFNNISRVGFEENFITYADYTKMLRRYRIKEPLETENIIEKIIETRKDLQ